MRYNRESVFRPCCVEWAFCSVYQFSYKSSFVVEKANCSVPAWAYCTFSLLFFQVSYTVMTLVTIYLNVICLFLRFDVPFLCVFMFLPEKARRASFAVAVK